MKMTILIAKMSESDRFGGEIGCLEEAKKRVLIFVNRLFQGQIKHFRDSGRKW